MQKLTMTLLRVIIVVKYRPWPLNAMIKVAGKWQVAQPWSHIKYFQPTERNVIFCLALHYGLLKGESKFEMGKCHAECN